MKSKARFGITAGAVAAMTLITPALQASASSTSAAVKSSPASSGSGPGQNLSATASPTWQTNNIVWTIAPDAALGVVWVGGQFTSVRPPGDPAGTGEVAQQFLAEFSSSTGNLITSFNPTLDGLVHALALSPDGKTLYAGGAFQNVNGAQHEHLAAFDTSTGALITTWKPTTNNPVNSIAPSPDGSTIYLGGSFTKVDSAARTYAGAVDAAGKLTAWAPTLDASLTSVAVAPDDSRVLVGGYFSTLDGVAQNSIGTTDPTTGGSEPWSANILHHSSGCTTNVKDIVVKGATAYMAVEGTGGGCFDGTFAANISDGSLVWLNNCLGATQAIAIVNNWLYKGSHAHDCDFSPGGYPQQPPQQAHHLLNESLTDGTLGHWTPNTNAGSAAGSLGPRTMATDGTQLFVGGDFTQVNGANQQGFTRFGPAPDNKPGYPAAPTVTSTSAGVDSVTFNGVSDPDDGTLTYSIFRDTGKTAIGSVTATSWPWAIPVLHYRDAGLTSGISHTYTVSVSDGSLSTSKSPASAPVTVSGTNPPLSYPATVQADSPSLFWRLNETSGNTAGDSSGHGFAGIYEPGTTQGAPGPIPGDPATATTFDGQSGLVTSASQVPTPGPQTFSIELWFKTTTNQGGKLIGFGNAQTGFSSSYDRHVYMMNDGQLTFGVWTGSATVIETPRVYNDGVWHHVVATIGPSGMALYVDGQLTGTNSNTSVQGYAGYWRVGGDNLGGWNLDPWGSNSQGTTQPYSYYFQGTIGDVAVYPAALSAAQVAAHYAANAGDH